MKKILLSALLILGFAGYALFQRFGDDDVNVVAPASLTQNPVPSDSASSGTPASSSPPAATPTPVTPSQASLYKDGQFTGNVTDAFYGNVQVQAIISGGKITDVVFLQYPNDRGTSREINGQAMPYLKAEAIQAQSASVDVVSGATQTSEAFIKSLGSALIQAKA